MSDTNTRHVAIIGAGVTGLTAGYRLRQAGVACTIFEASPRAGGKLLTRREDGFVLELGADAILTRKPWAWELAHELGLQDRVLPVNRVRTGTYVLHGGRPVPLPDGLSLLVPTRLGPFVRSPLFSPWGKVRALAEMFIPPERGGADESLARFITRRLGREMLDKVADPMLAGVFNGESDRQSILATFPQFRELESRHGSLIRGLRKTTPAGQGGAMREGTTGGEKPAFFSFRTGTQELTDALAGRLARNIRLGTAVSAVARESGGGFVVNGQRFSHVLVATPAAVAAELLGGVASEAAGELRSLRHTGIATAYFAYRRAEVPHALDGYGVVVPRSQGRQIDGMMWSSSKWPGRVPEADGGGGVALIRVFFGGPHTRHTLSFGDDDALAMARGELESILGVTAPPLRTWLYRWPEGYPQYDVGHLDRVARIRGLLPAGVLVAGSPYTGVGVPDCVRQANEAVERLLQQTLP